MSLYNRNKLNILGTIAEKLSKVQQLINLDKAIADYIRTDTKLIIKNSIIKKATKASFDTKVGDNKLLGSADYLPHLSSFVPIIGNIAKKFINFGKVINVYNAAFQIFCFSLFTNYY